MDTFQIKNGHFIFSFSLSSLEKDWQALFGSFRSAVYGFFSGSIKDLSTLDGEFVLFHFDGQNLMVIRDQLGVIPAYYVLINGRIVLSNSITHLANSCKDFGKDLTINADYFRRLEHRDFSNQTETPFLEIRKLPPWHFLSVTPAACETCRYGSLLDLVGQPLATGDLQQLLVNSLLKRLPSSTKATLFVSGGFDSSALHFLSESLNLKVESLSVDFTRFPAKEENGLRTLDNYSKRPVRRFLFEDFRQRIPNSKSWPILKPCNPGHAFFTPLLEWAVKNKSTLIMTGLGGDDLFTPPVSHYIWQNKFRWRHLTELSFFEIRSGVIGLLKQALRKSLPHFLLGKLNRKHKIYRDLKLNLYQIALAERFEVGGGYVFGMETEQEYAQEFGLRMTFPLLDLGMVRWVFQNSDITATSWTVSKPHFRESVKDLVPEEIRNVRSRQDMSAEFISLLDTSTSLPDLTTRIINEYKNNVFEFLQRRPHRYDSPEGEKI